MDPEQTAPIGAVWSGSTLFAIEASLTFQQTRKADNFSCDWRIKGNPVNELWVVYSLLHLSERRPCQQDEIRFTWGKFGWGLLSFFFSLRSPDMTEILLTGTLSLNSLKDLRSAYAPTCISAHWVLYGLFIKKWIRFLEGSWNHEYIRSLAKKVKPKGLHITFAKDPSIHDSMNLPKIEFIAYIYILL